MIRAKITAAALVMAFSSILAAQTAAKDISRRALDSGSAGESINFLKKEIPQITSAAEKRALLILLGSLQEQISAFKDASDSYAQAAGIAVSAASAGTEGLPKRTTPQLVLDAVRCALCAGDSTTAGNYLNSAVRNSVDENIQALIKLYEVWSALCRLDSAEKLEESAALLKTYVSLPSMKSVKPSLLLTLWYITGEASYGDALKKEAPKSPEAAVVDGRIQMMPAPFWYFMPKRGSALALSAESAAESQKITVETVASAENEESEKPAKLQLGLFKNRANADALCENLKTKGFSPYITQETRPSGTTYYLVIVDENKKGTMSTQLKSAGFECYPIF